MAKSTVGTYKKTAWKSCSFYVKVRDCDSNGMVKCCTCPTVLHIKSPDCHAGHFVNTRCNAVLLDDAHIFPQCAKCNMWGAGEQFKYGLFLKEKYGYSDDQLDEIQNMKHKTVKFTLEQLKEKKRIYDEETNRLIKEKGLSNG